MQENQEVCELCLRRITNPVCTNCYLKHVRSWLRDFGLSEKKIERAIEIVRTRLPQETLNKSNCVLCDKEVVSICMYCSFLRTSQILIQLGAGRKELEHYEDSSNFSREAKMRKSFD